MEASAVERKKKELPPPGQLRIRCFSLYMYMYKGLEFPAANKVGGPEFPPRSNNSSKQETSAHELLEGTKQPLCQQCPIIAASVVLIRNAWFCLYLSVELAVC